MGRGTEGYSGKGKEGHLRRSCVTVLLFSRIILINNRYLSLNCEVVLVVLLKGYKTAYNAIVG